MMKTIPYLGQENSLDEVPLFCWQFKDALIEQGFLPDIATAAVWHASRILDGLESDADVDAFCQKDLEKVASLIPVQSESRDSIVQGAKALLTAYCAAPHGKRDALNPIQETVFKSFSPAFKGVFDSLCVQGFRPQRAFIIADSARQMVQNLQKEHAVNSFCAGCAIYGVSKEEYKRIEMSIYKYPHSHQTLGKAAEIAKQIILGA